MVQMKAVYQGDLHCEAVHDPSGSRLETDAPKDNQGRGERFSPTDLVATALATCILTTMGIVAKRDGVSMDGATADVEKEMVSSPTRRIGALRVTVHLPTTIPTDYRKKIEAIALGCPVHRSLHPDVQAPVKFAYNL